jgi:probable HAF family extracellular repeat protein
MRRLLTRLRRAVLVVASLAWATPLAAWTIVDLGTLGGSSSEAWAVSNSGVVVGASRVPSGFAHAFLWHPNTGSMTDLGTLGGQTSAAVAIDDLGHIVGSSTLPSSDPVPPDLRRGFLTSPFGGSLASLGTFLGKGTPKRARSTRTGRSSAGSITSRTGSERCCGSPEAPR